MRNFKLTLSYDGTDFNGWQRQPDCRTVQATLEQAIAQITGEPRIRATASGRTDAGVHAPWAEWSNCFSATRLEAAVLRRAINAHLPDDMAVLALEEVPETFDANQAVRKLYRYVIHDGDVPSPFLRRFACHNRRKLDAAAMALRRRLLFVAGTTSTAPFETEWPNRMSSVRTITHLAVHRCGEYIWLDVEADGFLYNMVRAIAGTLMNVGRGYWPEAQVAAILEAGDRTLAGPTAPAQGLFLVRVTY